MDVEDFMKLPEMERIDRINSWYFKVANNRAGMFPIIAKLTLARDGTRFVMCLTGTVMPLNYNSALRFIRESRQDRIGRMDLQDLIKNLTLGLAEPDIFFVPTVIGCFQEGYAGFPWLHTNTGSLKARFWDSFSTKSLVEAVLGKGTFEGVEL